MSHSTKKITQNNKALLDLVIGHGQEKVSESLGDMDELFEMFIDTEYACDIDVRQRMLASIKVVRGVKTFVDTTPEKKFKKLEEKLYKTFQDA